MRLVLIGLAMLAMPATNKRRNVKVNVEYHKSYGIPHAATIRALENEIFSKQTDAEVDVDDPFSDNWIFGGEAIRTHPYMGGLVIDIRNGKLSVCGSSLLTQNRLVTAAHCWWDGRRRAWRFTVVLGSSWLFYGGTRIKTSDVVMHPQWNSLEQANNIAIIYLPGNVWFSAKIQPILLASPDQDWNQLINYNLTAVGFERIRYPHKGHNYSVISEVKLRAISLEKCRDFYGHLAHSTNVCTGRASRSHGRVCHGDSGGPLVVNRSGSDVLVGITSFVPQDCLFGYPSVFTRITSFYNFILQHLELPMEL